MSTRFQRIQRSDLQLDMSVTADRVEAERLLEVVQTEATTALLQEHRRADQNATQLIVDRRTAVNVQGPVQQALESSAPGSTVLEHKATLELTYSDLSTLADAAVTAIRGIERLTRRSTTAPHAIDTYVCVCIDPGPNSRSIRRFNFRDLNGIRRWVLDPDRSQRASVRLRGPYVYYARGLIYNRKNGPWSTRWARRNLRERDFGSRGNARQLGLTKALHARVARIVRAKYRRSVLSWARTVPLYEDRMRQWGSWRPRNSNLHVFELGLTLPREGAFRRAI